MKQVPALTRKWSEEDKKSLCELVSKNMKESGRIQWEPVAIAMNLTINEAKRQFNNIKTRHPAFLKTVPEFFAITQFGEIESESKISTIESSFSTMRSESLSKFHQWTPEDENTLKLCVENFGPNTESIRQFFPQLDSLTLEKKVEDYQNGQGEIIFDSDNYEESSETMEIVPKGSFD